MRFNERQMILVSHQKADFEDRLNYKKVTIVLGNSQNKGFKELWFKLIYNLLFYFKFNEFGQIDLTQPTGMIVLENSLVQYEEDSETPFAFSIIFQGDPKKHLFAARSEDTVRKWMVALKKASCEQLKKEVQLLEEAISQKKKKLEGRLNFGPTLHPVGSETVENGGTQTVVDALINF
ncbi:pleckstrin homology domain-containing family J member 1-like isoform X2 [Rhodnius prolixus]|uniref:Pleckstrin homology domain-containing family J member 1 n=2 Tax=Rhodnius TaxID=13248 RepID=A0A4P6D8G8_RHOPR